MTNILCSLKLINCALNIDLKLAFSLFLFSLRSDCISDLQVFITFFGATVFTRMTVEGREESRGSLIESLLLFFTIETVTTFASNVH